LKRLLHIQHCLLDIALQVQMAAAAAAAAAAAVAAAGCIRHRMNVYEPCFVT
jgi:hypothetical protein